MDGPSPALEAARLIYFGLDVGATTEDLEYRNLVSRFNTDEEFAKLVRDIGRGLRLRVVQASGKAGLIMAPWDRESMFSLSLTDYRASLNKLGDSNDMKRGVLALLQIGTALTYFPSGDDLDDESRPSRPIATPRMVVETVEKICERIMDEETKQASLPAAVRVGFQEVLAMPRTRENAQRADVSSLGGFARLIFRHLESQKLVEEIGGEGLDAQYAATLRYQLLIRDFGAPESYDICQQLLAASTEG